LVKVSDQVRTIWKPDATPWTSCPKKRKILARKAFPLYNRPNNGYNYVVAERKPSFSPISASGSNFNPQNTPGIPGVKIFAVLDFDEKSWFSFGHYNKTGAKISPPLQDKKTAIPE